MQHGFSVRDALLLRTKLTPPRLHRRVLPRPALVAKLREALDYRLTIVQAGTGYGKTTALAALNEPIIGAQFPVAGTASEAGQAPNYTLVWYTLDESDSDPQQFLAYLIGAFRSQVADLPHTPLVVLDELGRGELTAHWSKANGSPVVDALINALAESLRRPALLVLDDYHYVAKSPEIGALVERLVTFAPADLHVIAATRHPFALPGMVGWRAKNQMREIGRPDLAFQPHEIAALFRDTYGMALTPAEVAALADKTEGWPIALQLVWQGLRSEIAGAGRGLAPAGEKTVRTNAVRDSISDLLLGAHSETSPWPVWPTGQDGLAALFDYLAIELLDRQPPEIAAFLVETAVLRSLSPAACDAVVDATTCGANAGYSAAILGWLHELDLFVIALGEGQYRYHHLFHDFLRTRTEADPAAVSARHRRAAQHFERQGQHEEAIYHWLAAGNHAAAAAGMEAVGELALRTGRLDTLVAWIDALPADVLATRPLLQAFLGDICRLGSRFDEALGWYATAEQTWRARNDPAGISRALHGQAMIYLDTVRPAQAESVLQEAVRLFERIPDRQAQARLLGLMAENKLNTGKPAEAEALRGQARALLEEGPAEDTLSVRAKIRTGRLSEAQQILETWFRTEQQASERGESRPPRAHRETALLLSLIHALRGEAEQAFTSAREGIILGERLNSPFVTAVGHMRLGHALQLTLTLSRQLNPSPMLRTEDGGTDEVVDAAAVASTTIGEPFACYNTAIALGDRMAVRRTRAEAMWGLTRAYGYRGDVAAAQRAAAEGVEICRWAGDPWVESLTQLALGASHVLAGRPAEGVAILSDVLTAFRNCGDMHGRAATRLWLALAYRDLRQGEHLASSLEALLELCEANGYDSLLTTPTLAGVPNPRRIVPLLLEARSRRIRPAYVARLLAALGLAEIQVHPGYQLQVQTLGGFRVWRGDAGEPFADEVAARDWQRDKARQLFQLFLTERGRWLQRDELTERLWPHLSPESAARDFKVALNALNRAIEPARSADAPFAYIVRDGSAYRLRPEADLWLDAAIFRQECEAGLRLAARAEAAAAIAHLQAGVNLYRGDYLPDALYEDWAGEERERLLALWLRAADTLAGILIERGSYDEGLKLCEAILARDTCWENAYRLMMLAHARRGNRPQAFRAFQRCIETLRAELDVPPSAETVSLYGQVAAEPVLTGQPVQAPPSGPGSGGRAVTPL
jgi:ATP/maltotriose-dependent transcriptional regulator MalT/DNA-binding SARP family transcriptional activator